jgi:hypothetical protein
MVCLTERSRGSVELEALISAEPEVSKRLQGRIHRTQLWRYTRSKPEDGRFARPDLDTALIIEAETEGRIPVQWWSEISGQEQGAA